MIRKSQFAARVVLITALSASVIPAPAADVVAQTARQPVNGELGFVVTAFAPAIYQGGKDECPDGFAGTVRENYLATLPPDERERLLQKANEPELTRRWKAYSYGPDNTNVCANAEQFPDRPMQKLFQGKVAYGLNLDGRAGGQEPAPDGCAHENFTSPAGEAGIDNQAYRALGCTRNYRGVDGVAGDIVPGFNRLLATGEHGTVLLLRGVDSLTDDDDVEVILANTDDRPVVDSKQNFIAGASFTVGHNPRWRNVLRGHILRGVLTTDAADIHLTKRVGHGGIRGAHLEWDLRRARLQFTFRDDGSIHGLLGAYQPVRNVIDHTLAGGHGAAIVAGIDCAAEYVTLRKLADGMRDPQTGACTAISMALDFAGVPAYVFDRPPNEAAASAASSAK